MPSNPFAGLGLQHMNWQSAPSLTGGAVEKMSEGLKKAVVPMALQALGIPAWLDTLGQSSASAPVAPPSVGGVPAVPAIPSAPSVPSMMAPQSAAKEPEIDEDINETIWGQ